MRPFAIDPKSEELFQRGWPELRTLVDDHPHLKDPAKWSQKAFHSYAADIYHVAWPREVAHRFVRIMGMPRKELPLAERLAAIAEQAKVAGPVTEAEARSVLARIVHPESRHPENNVKNLLFLLEAMVGGDVVFDAALSVYEELSDAQLEHDNLHDPLYVADWLGFVLRRLDRAAQEAGRARVAALLGRWGKHSVWRELTRVIGGAPAVLATKSPRAAGIWLHTLHHVDDAKFIVENAHRDNVGSFDIQLAFRGGEPVLEWYAKRLPKLPKERLAGFVEELALVASPKAVEMLRVLHQKKSVSARVAEVLATRGEAPQPSAPAKTLGPEKRFDELSAWIQKALKAARGDAAKEEAALLAAVDRYAEIRSDAGEPPGEFVVQFFMVDGVALEKERPAPLTKLRPKPTDAEWARWTEILQR
ncbi:MAG: hypothetical protein KIT84_05380 [Labilithrix sp.]|nr:hypothetical protein [Labilithrix sp.]MCW5810419.1 hypothetical protein [Labilithrix sp.]